MNWELSSFLRTIAITVVILIHASHSWWFGAHGEASLTQINLEISIDTAINQVGRLAVPIFVILSGFGLAESELSKPFELKGFIQRRCLRILPPYIFFTILNLSFSSQFQSIDWQDKLSQIFTALRDGSGDYHLYFLAIIMQCYISYPLLRHVRFSPLRFVGLLVGTFSLFSLRWGISLFGWFPSIAPYLPDSNSCIFWLPYFMIGIWLAKHQEWFAKLVQKYSADRWGMFWSIAAALELGEFYFAAVQMGGAEPAGHYGRPTVVLLTLTFLGWAISWQNQAGQDRAGRDGWLKKNLDTLGKSSFTIYLLHTQVLRLIAPLEFLGGIGYLLIASIASWLIGFWVWKIAKPIKGLNLILGA